MLELDDEHLPALAEHGLGEQPLDEAFEGTERPAVALVPDVGISAVDVEAPHRGSGEVQGHAEDRADAVFGEHRCEVWPAPVLEHVVDLDELVIKERLDAWPAAGGFLDRLKESGASVGRGRVAKHLLFVE